MRIGDRRIAGWSDLTDAEHYLLSEALEPGPPTFIDVVNGWVSSPDAAYWNRKEPYVKQLIPAALRMLRAGLIEVWSSADGQHGTVLEPGDAQRALADVSNWWEYDPDGNWDPGEDLRRYAQYELTVDSPRNPLFGAYSINETAQTGRLARDEPARLRRPLASPVVTFDAATRQALGPQALWDSAFRHIAAGGAGQLRCPECDGSELQPAWSARSELILGDGTYRVTGSWTLTCRSCGAAEQTLTAEAIRTPAPPHAHRAGGTEAGSAANSSVPPSPVVTDRREKVRSIADHRSPGVDPAPTPPMPGRPASSVDRHRAVRGWSDLTDAEHHVMTYADLGDVVSILHMWVPSPDGREWNRMETYAQQLMAAALNLLRNGLIDVRLTPENGTGAGLTLDPAGAERALGTITNWWFYDPGAATTPDRDLDRHVEHRPAPRASLPRTWRRYRVDTTDLAERLLQDEAPGVVRPINPTTPLADDAVRPVPATATRWAQAFRQVATGHANQIRCPENDDGDLAASWDVEVEDLPGDGAYTVVGLWTLSCSRCGAQASATTAARFINRQHHGISEPC